VSRALEIRPIRADEFGDYNRVLARAFRGVTPDPVEVERFSPLVELERTRCAFEDGELVGTCNGFVFELSVPGALLPTSGTTQVSVLPTHRRRGILRALMRAHLEDTSEQGEPLAALWASESSIYERFGYGCASFGARLRIERAHAAFADPHPPAGRVRLVERKQALELLPPLFEHALERRPGMFSRSRDWWELRSAFERAPDRGPDQQYTVYERGGEPRGYLRWRYRAKPHPLGLRASELEVVELQALDPEAHRALWRFALDVDLVEYVEAWNQPLDDPLRLWLLDSRRLETSVRDGLWLRLVDVARALGSRRYVEPGHLRFELADEFCAWNSGRYELEAGERGAQCKRTSAEPELWLTAAELASAYLGGNRLQALAAAGRVRGEAKALRRADRLLAWDPLPWCPEIF
jgi:predicted acetyltransferase